MLIIAASGLLGIRDKIIAFVIACNWGKAFIEWLHAPFTVLQLLLPEAYILHWLSNISLLVISVFILYRLFQAALNKNYQLYATVHHFLRCYKCICFHYFA